MGTPDEMGVLLVGLGLVMYAVSAGADFGGGVWTALASGPRADEQREALFQAIGPVWETNHVWLVYIIVALFTCFPRGFEALSIALIFPLVFSLVGVNFRGAAFVFRHFGRHKGARIPGVEAVFSISSVLTPFFMGMAVSSIAGGRIRVAPSGPALSGQAMPYWGAADWITPFTIVGGLIGLSVCAYLTPIYMAARTAGGLRDDFRRRAIAGALALGFLTAIEVVVARFDAPLFFWRFVRPLPLALAALAAFCGCLTLVLLLRRAYGAARWVADFAVAFTISGFAAALYPYMIIGQLSLAQAAAGRQAILAVLTTLPIGAALLAPSLFLLYRTFAMNLISGGPGDN
ncbi:MAG: cytochrome d ubiquinol oxidase subunit II [Nitrospiraceae bacterium]|nr:cytochrome d ubiquinol oxidase subunit II [Nitrospiraceae bacterium]